MYLPDRIWALRNRLLASPRFQRLASTLPFIRSIARRRARASFDLLAGFVYSQVLRACVQLELFALLDEGPQTIAALAPRLQLSPAATTRLLKAAASLRLVDARAGERYGLGVHGAAIHGNPGIAAMVLHHALLYDDLRDPVALLRGELPYSRLSEFWPYAKAGASGSAASEQVGEYSRLMSGSQSLVVSEVLDAWPLSRYRCLLDVGGGDGCFAANAAQRFPGLRVQLFDLPAVAALARARFATAGLGDRAAAVGGDFLSDELPRGADVISLVRVLHDHDDERVLKILGAARRALPDGGTLLIAEPLAATPGAEAMGAAYFGFYLLAMGRGQARSAVELAVLLRSAGFAPPTQIATRIPLQTGLLIAIAQDTRERVNPA